MQNQNLDPLTGLRSRAYAQAVLEDLIAHADAGDQIGLIYLDVDNFKPLNECFGHNLGDVYLSLLAQTLKEVVGRDRVVARFSGNKFLIVVPEAGTEKTVELAERIRARAATVTIEYHEGKRIEPLTLTLGVSCFPDDGQTALKLLEAADLAVIIGKNHGKNRVMPARHPLRRDAPPC